jgi:uncharacterized membrane protein
MSRKNLRPVPEDRATAGGNRARTIMFSVAAVVAVLGVAEATYLTVLHLSGANVVCLGAGQCSEVLRSKWASIGPVPLAALGGLAYFIAFSSATLAAFGSRRAPVFLGTTVALMFLATLGLLYLQAFVLHAFCDYCLLSAAFIFLLSGLLIALPRRD